MNNWWKSPVLQGEENDYGDYDYLIEDIPSNSTKWSRYEQKCDECGKTRRLNLVYTYCFRTLDGWDSMDSCECWRCYLKRIIKKPFKAIKNKIKCLIKQEKEVCRLKKVFKKANRPLTKEIRKTIREVVKRYVKYN